MPVRLRVLAIGMLLARALFAPPLHGAQQPITPPGAIVQGSVVDDELAPVLGATVTLEQSEKTIYSAQTDKTGWFKIERVVAGTYQAGVAAKGFTVASKDVVIKNGGPTVVLAFALKRVGEP